MMVLRTEKLTLIMFRMFLLLLFDTITFFFLPWSKEIVRSVSSAALWYYSNSFSKYSRLLDMVLGRNINIKSSQPDYTRIFSYLPTKSMFNLRFFSLLLFLTLIIVLRPKCFGGS